MPNEPFRRIKSPRGVRNIRGASSLQYKGSQSAESKLNAKLFKLGVEKDSLTKALKQFEGQKEQIEKRLSEIAEAIQSELPEPEGQQESNKREESSTPEKKDDQNNPTEKKVEFDFRIGKMSFGDIMQGVSSFIDAVSKLEEEGKGEERREGEFTSPSGRVKAVYGLSIKEGLEGRSFVESFGNVKKTPQGPVVEEEREPLVDVFDEQDHVSVIVELPGVQVKDIHTEVTGDILTLSAAGSSRKYYKEVVLPKNIDASTLKSTYRNGILDIRVNKK